MNAQQQLQYNIALAFDIGLEVPELKYLRTIPEEERDAVVNDPFSWRIYPYLNLAIQRITGLEMTWTAWWDGERFKNITLSIQDKWLLDGNQGVELESNLVTVFKGETLTIGKHIGRLAKNIKEKDPEFKGFVSMDLIFKKGKAYYKAIHFGVSYDYVYCLSKMAGINPDLLAVKLEKNEDVNLELDYAGSVRLWSYPYEAEYNKEVLLENSEHILEGDESFICVCSGKSIACVWKRVYEVLHNSKLYEACYRTDGHYRATDIIYKLRKMKYIK